MIGHAMSSCTTHAKHGAQFIRTQREHCLCHAMWYHICSDVMRALHGASMQASQPH